MNKKMIKKTGLFLIFSTCLISGCDFDKPIQRFVNQRVVLASGYNFKTAKIVVLNPDNGKEVPACIQARTSRQDYQPIERKRQNEAFDMSYGRPKCKTELIINDTNSAIISALKLSRAPIVGMIKKDGEIIPARFVVTQTALFEGSDCNDDFSGGSQYENNCGGRKH